MSASEEVTNHLIKARDLATLACNYDENNQLTQAIQNYDEAILFIDEVLGKIPTSCDAYQLLMVYRQKYNSRMVPPPHSPPLIWSDFLGTIKIC
jgi:hypothetical protein